MKCIVPIMDGQFAQVQPWVIRRGEGILFGPIGGKGGLACGVPIDGFVLQGGAQSQFELAWRVNDDEARTLIL